jgi:hypothetical protein
MMRWLRWHFGGLAIERERFERPAAGVGSK